MKYSGGRWINHWLSTGLIKPEYHLEKLRDESLQQIPLNNIEGEDFKELALGESRTIQR
jgi:hypothetical protein